MTEWRGLQPCVRLEEVEVCVALTWSLVLEVDGRSAGLHHHLGEAHHSRQTSMSGVSVGDDRPVVVHVGGEGGGRGVVGLCLHQCAALPLRLFGRVEVLRAEQLVHLAWDGVVGVVGEVGAGFVAAGGRRRALPTAHVHSGQMGRHLHHLHGVQTAERVGERPTGEVAAQEGEQLPRQQLGRVRTDRGEGGAESDDGGGWVGTAGELPAPIAPTRGLRSHRLGEGGNISGNGQEHGRRGRHASETVEKIQRMTATRLSRRTGRKRREREKDNGEGRGAAGSAAALRAAEEECER